MFTATITEKSFFNGDLKVTVQFTNGTQTFKESMNITSENDMNNKIANRVDTLNGLETLAGTLATGVWTKPTPVVVAPTAIQLAEKAIYEQKRLIELGAVKETDQSYIDAVTAYKTLLGK